MIENRFVDFSGYTTLDLNLDDGVLVCTFNRPDVLNAIDMTMHDELEGLFDSLRRNEDVRAVVLTGAGRAFSAGGDVLAMAEGRMGELTGKPGGLYTREGLWIIRSLLGVTQPIVAAVNGAAVGLAATIAFYSDLVVASNAAHFSDPHVNIGLVAGDGATVIWPALVGPLLAKRYLLTGERLSATEAHRLGLVTDLVAPEDLLPTAMAMARKLADNSAPAVQWTKAAINRTLWERTVTGLDTSLALEAISASTTSHREAVEAFAHARKNRSR